VAAAASFLRGLIAAAALRAGAGAHGRRAGGQAAAVSACAAHLLDGGVP